MKNDDSRSYAVVLWDLEQGNYEVVCESSEPLFSVKFSPDGTKLAFATWNVAGTKDSAVLLYDVETRKQIASLRGAPLQGLGHAFTSDILTIAFSPDGASIAAGTKMVGDEVLAGSHIGGEVCVWDVALGELKWSNRVVHTDIVYGVAYSPDGQRLASAGRDKLVRIWDSDSGELRRTLFGSGWLGAMSVDYSHDGVLIAIGGGSGVEEGGVVRIWDVESGNAKHIFRPTRTGFHQDAVVHVCFSPRRQHLFAFARIGGSTQLTSQLQQWTLGEEVTKRVLLTREGSGPIAVSPDATRVAVGFEKEVVIVTVPVAD